MDYFDGLSRAKFRALFAGRSIASLILGVVYILPASAAEPLVPDLSGQWGRDMPHLEKPSSGPGPIINTIRNASGNIDAGINGLAGDYRNPILTPKAAEIIRKRGEIFLKGLSAPDPHNQCWPEPPPFILSVQYGLQVLQAKTEVILIYLADHKVRHVPLQMARARPVTPSWQGDSIGWYEGDTLVIDTVGIKIGPISMVDPYGTPHSNSLHVVERYRLIDGDIAADAQRKHADAYADPNGDRSQLPFEALSPPYGRGPIDPDTTKKGLQVEFTVEDPDVFMLPWSGLVTYRLVNGDWPETVCAENLRDFGKERKVPRADKADF